MCSLQTANEGSLLKGLRVNSEELEPFISQQQVMHPGRKEKLNARFAP